MEIEGYPDYKLHFDEETGQPKVWSDKTGRGRKTADSWLKPRLRNGYLAVPLCNAEGIRNKPLHRLVGECCIPNPDNLPTLDHINGDKLDNQIQNLRWANQSTQARNRPSTKGFCFNKAAGKWHARIKIDGRLKHLGYFKTEAEARAAYVSVHNMFFSDIVHLE